MRPFCRKKPCHNVHKIPRFRGGGFGVFGGGGEEVPILFFMGARIFLKTIPKRPFGLPRMNFPEFPGVPESHFRGKMELICWAAVKNDFRIYFCGLATDFGKSK